MNKETESIRNGSILLFSELRERGDIHLRSKWMLVDTPEEQPEKSCETCNCNRNSGDIDADIKPIVDALNSAGIETDASCCGHTYQPSRISLIHNGVEKELLLCTYDQAQAIGKLFPDINGKQPIPEPQGEINTGDIGHFDADIESNIPEPPKENECLSCNKNKQCNLEIKNNHVGNCIHFEPEPPKEWKPKELRGCPFKDGFLKDLYDMTIHNAEGIQLALDKIKELEKFIDKQNISIAKNAGLIAALYSDKEHEEKK